jgi:carbamoyl-phosphate synthase small subunit
MLGKVVVNDTDVALDDPNDRNIVAEVSTAEPALYPAAGPAKCVLVDLGAKNNIIRSLNKRGISVLKVPWNYDWTAEDVDGVLLSNGPGNPKMCGEAIAILRKGLERDVPILGICLGHQLLALAAGGDTYKMKYGHRSQNQPCLRVGSKRCYITSQNHGFAVNDRTLDSAWEPWFFNANDGTNEGIRHRTLPFSSVQFHPEANPGPSDTESFFDNFLAQLTHVNATS